MEISRQTTFNDAQRTAIAKLRADVQKGSVKARMNPKGARVGYVDPRIVEVPLERRKKKGNLSEEANKSVKWICLPYFALEPYSGLLAASSTSFFPPSTLLQGQYSRTGQQRDMDQAVAQLGCAPKGTCFHIEQLWCLILDNTFLVTCGNLSQAELQGDTLKMTSEPSPEPSMALAAGAGRISVSYGDSVTWTFTTAECPNWFAFISNFFAFWPQRLEFKYKNQCIGPDSWSRILAIATSPRSMVSLKMKIS